MVGAGALGVSKDRLGGADVKTGCQGGSGGGDGSVLGSGLGLLSSRWVTSSMMGGLWWRIRKNLLRVQYGCSDCEKRAQVVVDAVKGVWFEPYSRQDFENWAEGLYQVCKKPRGINVFH